MRLTHLLGASKGVHGVRRRRPTIVAIVASVAALAVLVSAASAAIPGYERVTASSDHDSVRPKEATAQCAAGKRVVGIGGQVYSYNYPNRSRTARRRWTCSSPTSRSVGART